MPPVIQDTSNNSAWPQWNMLTDISVNDVATIFLLLIAIATFLMSYYESKRKNKTERMVFVKELIEPFRTDRDISSAFYKIEYHQFHYNTETFHLSELELEIDKLLSHCNLVCCFYRNKIITKSEFSQFEYYMARIAGNSGVQDYFAFLDDWSKRADINSNFDDFRAMTEPAVNKRKQKKST